MTRMPIVFLALAAMGSGGAGFATGSPESGWAHAGNTYNSAIFVDRAVLSVAGRERRFRTLHINSQPQSGWLRAEHHAVINCAAATVRHGDGILTRTDGRVETRRAALGRAVAFPKRGVVNALLTSICARRLGPAIADPQRWTRANFRPA